jgi:hypothetical protein
VKSSLSLNDIFSGVDLGKAYDILPHLKNEKFFAAVTLKVSKQNLCCNLYFCNYCYVGIASTADVLS